MRPGGPRGTGVQAVGSRKILDTRAHLGYLSTVSNEYRNPVSDRTSGLTLVQPAPDSRHHRVGHGAFSRGHSCEQRRARRA